MGAFDRQTRDWLSAARRHVLGAVAGLDDEQGRRSVAPSGWSMVGAVHHLAVDVERFWFGAVLAGRPVELMEGGGWTPPEGMGVEQVLALYEEEIRLADEILDAWTDEPPRWWWPGEGAGPYGSVTEILHHVLVETATHAGHLDMAREAIDGHQHLVLEED